MNFNFFILQTISFMKSYYRIKNGKKMESEVNNITRDISENHDKKYCISFQIRKCDRDNSGIIFCFSIFLNKT